MQYVNKTNSWLQTQDIYLRWTMLASIWVFRMPTIWKSFRHLKAEWGLPWANSVTTTKSVFVSNESSILMTFSWCRVLSISISCLSDLISLSVLPCFRINFNATILPEYFRRPLYTYKSVFIWPQFQGNYFAFEYQCRLRRKVGQQRTVHKGHLRHFLADLHWLRDMHRPTGSCRTQVWKLQVLCFIGLASTKS